MKILIASGKLGEIQDFKYNQEEIFSLNMPNIQPALLFVICGPSGVGKDTLTARLLAARPELAKVITSTTRTPRPNEIPGSSYHFYQEAEFLAAKERGEFIETANVHGKWYGTSKQAISDVFDAGKMPLCIIDIQGVQIISKKEPLATIFITASLATIEKRVTENRPAGEVAGRMASAKKELEYGLTLEHVLSNDDGELEIAVKKLIEYYDHQARPRLAAYNQTRKAKPEIKTRISR